MANRDLNRLLNLLVPFAMERLGRHGTFQPIAAVVNAIGVVTPSVACAGNAEPFSGKHVAQIIQNLKSQVGEGGVSAVAICKGVLALGPGESEKRDAILCSLEHQNGDSINYYVPYAINSITQEIEFGKTFAMTRTPLFFTDNQSAFRCRERY